MCTHITIRVRVRFRLGSKSTNYTRAKCRNCAEWQSFATVRSSLLRSCSINKDYQKQHGRALAKANQGSGRRILSVAIYTRELRYSFVIRFATIGSCQGDCRQQQTSSRSITISSCICCGYGYYFSLKPPVRQTGGKRNCSTILITTTFHFVKLRRGSLFNKINNIVDLLTSHKHRVTSQVTSHPNVWIDVALYTGVIRKQQRKAFLCMYQQLGCIVLHRRHWTEHRSTSSERSYLL